MENISVLDIALTILTSIITGGFILVLIEIGNRKSRENDNYNMIMKPFTHKLTSYFRFINWVKGHVQYPQEKSNVEIKFQNLMDSLGRYGSMAIMAGDDYGIDHFSAKQLNDITTDINNLWYWHNKMKPCNLKWDNYNNDTEFINRELGVLNPEYLLTPQNIELIVNVSSDFYCYTYKPIEYEIALHENALVIFRKQSLFVLSSVSYVVVFLCLLLFLDLPQLCLQLSTILAVALFLFSLCIITTSTKKLITTQLKIKEKRNTISLQFRIFIKKWKNKIFHIFTKH